MTYIQAITAIQQLTGLDYYRANKIYKAELLGDCSGSRHQLEGKIFEQSGSPAFLGQLHNRRGPTERPLG